MTNLYTRLMLAASVAAAIGTGVSAGVSAGAAQGPGGPPGFGGPQSDMQLVKQFDTDGDKRLNTAERKLAREFAQAQAAGRGRGFGGRGFGRNAATGQPGIRVEPASVPAVATAVPFYDPATVRTLFFTFEAADWEKELMAFKNTDVEVPATLMVDGREYKDVGMSFRGNSSFMMVPEGLKHSFNVTVDFAHSNQNVLGYRTLNLLNGNGDPSMLRGVVFQHIASDFIPAASANFVRVVVNGEYWGVYSNIEQMNRDFIEARFKGENGTRWKVPGSPGSRAGLEFIGDDPEAYKRLFEIKNKDNRRSWDALVNLTRVLNNTPTEGLEAALAPVLDIDGTLRFLALDNVLANSDGYWVRGSDYFLYLDEGGRVHVLPNDTNETFSSEGRGRGGRGGRGPGGSAQPSGTPGGTASDVAAGRGLVEGRGAGPAMMVAGPGTGSGATLDLLVGLDDQSKPLRSKLLAVPALRAKYLQYCRDIATKWLDAKAFGAVATAFHERIAADVRMDTRKLISTEQFETSLEELKAFVEARRAFVLAYQAR